MKKRQALRALVLPVALTACASSSPPPAMEEQPLPQAAPAEATGAPATAAPAAPQSSEQAAPETALAPPSFVEVERPPLPAELASLEKAYAAKEWQTVLDELNAKKAEILRAPFDVGVRARALEGLAYAGGGDEDKAEQTYRIVISRLAGADQKVRQSRKEDVDKHLAALNAAIAEALFFGGERARSKAEALAPPSYDGQPEADQVKKHFALQVAGWLRTREQAIERATKEYQKIDALKPPPTAWKVAAGARIAQMKGELVEALEALAPPQDWATGSAAASEPDVPAGKAAPPPGKAPAPPAKPPEDPRKKAFEQYQTAYQALLDPRKKAASEAFAKCHEEASSHEPDGAFAKYCKSRLAK
jgi:TolA-binding protein